jgi:hypothetical protein
VTAIQTQEMKDLLDKADKLNQRIYTTIRHLRCFEKDLQAALGPPDFFKIKDSASSNPPVCLVHRHTSTPSLYTDFRLKLKSQIEKQRSDFINLNTKRQYCTGALIELSQKLRSSRKTRNLNENLGLEKYSFLAQVIEINYKSAYHFYCENIAIYDAEL